MRTIELVNKVKERLARVFDDREAYNIALILLEDNHQIARGDLLLDTEVSIKNDQLEEELSRLLKGEPIQYVTGIADFYGRKFEIRKGALIPRPETEELVQLIVENHKGTSPFIWDIGTGSGCIAVSLSLEMHTKVLATDVSQEALRIAKDNGERLCSKVNWHHHDVLADKVPFDEIDVIVSNPPYIPLEEKSIMGRNVVDHEPETALFVPDNDPLRFYRKIAEIGKKVLNPQGNLYFEIHEHFGTKLKLLLESIGYDSVCVHQDMQGKDRMISAINSASK